MEENDCDDEAVCTNTLQGYNCRCATVGFTGNGKECTGKINLRLIAAKTGSHRKNLKSTSAENSM